MKTIIFLIGIFLVLSFRLGAADRICPAEIWQKIERNNFQVVLYNSGSFNILINGKKILSWVSICGCSTSFRKGLVKVSGKEIEQDSRYEAELIYIRDDCAFRITITYLILKDSLEVYAVTEAGMPMERSGGYLGVNLQLSGKSLTKAGLINSDTMITLDSESGVIKLKAGEKLHYTEVMKTKMFFEKMKKIVFSDLGGIKMEILFPEKEPLVYWRNGESFNQSEGLRLGTSRVLTDNIETGDKGVQVYIFKITSQAEQ